ncbi:MAG TPA: VIT1/CCC1 family protein [Microbacteriaceae bacterium]|nr:VIT1/CCC1 family protein [Microbacteriaceae bacterium]
MTTRSADRRRWSRYLANERAEAAVYRELAERANPADREILRALVRAEERHAQHWIDLLGPSSAEPTRADLRTRLLVWGARHFGMLFVLALAQRAETRSPYADDRDATKAMAADEVIHSEVVRNLAVHGRRRLSGSFRAAVFGANDGLVSNLALVMGIGATGVAPSVILFSGVAGLLAGAMSMAAGEYISVSSQRELLGAATPDPASADALSDLDVDANELALVYRARGMSHGDALVHANDVIRRVHAAESGARENALAILADTAEHEAVGSPMSAASSSFAFFASGAIIPVLPWLVGLSGFAAQLTALSLVGLGLLATGAVVGLLSGASPLSRGMRQLAIGFAAAAVTYGLGTLFGASLG